MTRGGPIFYSSVFRCSTCGLAQPCPEHRGIAANIIRFDFLRLAYQYISEKRAVFDRTVVTLTRRVGRDERLRNSEFIVEFWNG